MPFQVNKKKAPVSRDPPPVSSKKLEIAQSNVSVTAWGEGGRHEYYVIMADRGFTIQEDFLLFRHA